MLQKKTGTENSYVQSSSVEALTASAHWRFLAAERLRVFNRLE